MNIFLLPLVFIILKFILIQLFNLSSFSFDPLLLLVVFYTFFHSLDFKNYCGYAVYCGFCADIFSLDIFGIHILSYLGCAFVIASLSIVIYRENRYFVYPVLFLSVFLVNLFSFALKLFVFKAVRLHDMGLFLIVSFIQAFITVIFAFPFYKFSRKCVPELIR